MQDWKINQKIYRSLAVKQDIIGVHIPIDIIKSVNGSLTAAITQQFYDLKYIWIPAKSYCVALIYAYHLSKDYGGNITDYLDDSELLIDDQYFVRYSDDKDTYDAMLLNVEYFIHSPMADKIFNYYKKEIRLDDFNQEQ